MLLDSVDVRYREEQGFWKWLKVLCLLSILPIIIICVVMWLTGEMKGITSKMMLIGNRIYKRNNK